MIKFNCKTLLQNETKNVAVLKFEQEKFKFYVPKDIIEELALNARASHYFKKKLILDCEKIECSEEISFDITKTYNICYKDFYYNKNRWTKVGKLSFKKNGDPKIDLGLNFAGTRQNAENLEMTFYYPFEPGKMYFYFCCFENIKK